MNNRKHMSYYASASHFFWTIYCLMLCMMYMVNGEGDLVKDTVSEESTWIRILGPYY